MVILNYLLRREQLQYVVSIAKQVVEKLTLVDSSFFNEILVIQFTRVVCHYGSLAMEFQDAWAEGDGDRVLRCWKLFLPHFQAAGSAYEALRLMF